VNVGNLQSGISVCLQHPKWPRDFHNRLYTDLNGGLDVLDEQSWNFLLDELGRWRAIRGRTKDWIFARGVERITRLRETRQNIIDRFGRTPELSDLQWCDVTPLFTVAAEIKDVDSPVLPSKLCHLMLPGCFVVADRQVVGIRLGDYQRYWELCRDGWGNASNRDELLGILRAQIRAAVGKDGKLFASYPWGTKITELCFVGGRNR
jgi:hypothetical protein